jgi:DNA invertase Pin-like site-specific DNA recombinase
MSEFIQGVAYHRMSSNDQEGSIEQQQKWAADACARAGIEIVEEFIDAAKPGHETAKRTAFHRMLEFCRERYERRNPIDAIVCWHTNRFSRSDGIETSWFVHEFRKAGVNRMFTADRWIDFRRMEDRILFGITQDASNHPYVQELSQNSLRGRIATAQDGFWCGGPPPFGYRIEVCGHELVNGRKKPRRILVPDSDTAWLVTRLFHEYATGQTSLYQLARQLNNEGAVPPRHTKAWTPVTIRGILINEAYLGDFLWNKNSSGKFFGIVDCRITQRDPMRAGKRNDRRQWIRRTGRHEPLVSREVFDQVQHLLVENRRNRTPVAGGGNFTLTSLMRCGHCGAAMIGKNQPGSRKAPAGTKVIRFICAGYGMLGKQKCNFNSIDEAPLQRCIIRKIQEAFLNPSTLNKMREVARQEAAQGVNGNAEEEARLNDQLAQLDKQLAVAARKFLVTENDRASRECKKALDALTAERDRVEHRLRGCQDRTADCQDQEETIDRAVDLMNRFEEVIAGKDPAAKRAVLRGIIEHIDLYFDHRQTDQRTYSTFMRGVIYVKDDVLPSSYPLVVS